MIKFTDLYKLAPDKKTIFKKINFLIKNSQFIGGKEVVNFEREFSKFIGCRYCISVANGTDALFLSIKALNLKENSEAIVPANTWISTAEAVVNSGLKLVFCDINLEDYSMNLDDLKKKITKKTRLILPVHLYGNPTDMNGIKKIIKKRNIKIIEDCAQAHGSTINKKHVGTFGDIGTFSFFPGKNLGCFGDGGAVITNNKTYFDKLTRLRNHGAKGKYDHKYSGYNSRLDSIQAAILRIKLKHYKKVLKKRKELAKIYIKKLKEIKQIELFQLKKNFNTSYHQFVIRTNQRNDLQKYLHNKEIQTMIHYPYMLNELNFFKYKKKIINSHKLGDKILSLPISEEHNKKQIIFISKQILNFFKLKFN